jgi:hypothetical protein
MESNLLELEKNIENYYSETSNLIDIHNHYEKELEKYTSLNFNIFRYINVNENKISEIIVDILNPKGEHGQGSIFLNEFLQILGIDKRDKTPTINTEVLTRQHINNLRRMDILIDWIDFGIMIENKPRYDDKSDQLKDYAEDLKNKYGKRNFAMVYLSNDGHFPSEKSISKELKQELETNNQFVHITYNDKFKKWIEKCVILCQSEKYKWFLKEFLDNTLNNYL